jgi:uncharacterized FlaG/YvyC family protein
LNKQSDITKETSSNSRLYKDLKQMNELIKASKQQYNFEYYKRVAKASKQQYNIEYYKRVAKYNSR